MTAKSLAVPGTINSGLRLRSVSELWRYRDAIRALALLGLRMRYNNSFLGFLWSLGNPLFFLGIFAFVNQVMFANKTPNYAIFALSAMIPWNFFQAGIMSSMNSITGGRYLLTKLTFPREIMPLSGVLAELVNSSMALLVIVIITFLTDGVLSAKLLLLPFLLLLLTLFTAGFGLLLATANVWLRDTQEFMAIFTFGWFFLTPILYPITNIPVDQTILGVPLRTVIQIVNPMSTMLLPFRQVIYEHVWPDAGELAAVVVLSVAMFVVGLSIFRRASGRFAEAA